MDKENELLLGIMTKFWRFDKKAIKALNIAASSVRHEASLIELKVLVGCLIIQRDELTARGPEDSRVVVR